MIGLYLSRMTLDVTKRKTLQALSSPNLFHGAVESSFDMTEAVRQRNLWRIDQLNGNYYLLILSREKPDLSEAITQFAPEGEGWATKEYDPFLEKIKADSRWHFRLTANPTYQKAAGKDQRGRICAHTTADNQRKWLIKQGELHGFAVSEDSFEIRESKWYHFNKTAGKNQVSMLSVTYEGILKVVDEEKVRKVLTDGIGREKAYGVGLMTLVHVEKGTV